MQNLVGMVSLIFYTQLRKNGTLWCWKRSIWKSCKVNAEYNIFLWIIFFKSPTSALYTSWFFMHKIVECITLMYSFCWILTDTEHCVKSYMVTFSIGFRIGRWMWDAILLDFLSCFITGTCRRIQKAALYIDTYYALFGEAHPISALVICIRGRRTVLLPE